MYLIWYVDYVLLFNNCVLIFVDLYYILLFLLFSSYIMYWIWLIDFYCYVLLCVYIFINDFIVLLVIFFKINCFEGMLERLMGIVLYNGDVFYYIVVRFVIIC